MPLLPAFTTDLQASKSSTTSVIAPGATVKPLISFSPLCCALGVFISVSTPPVGFSEFDMGTESFDTSTSRICEYWPAVRTV